MGDRRYSEMESTSPPHLPFRLFAFSPFRLFAFSPFRFPLDRLSLDRFRFIETLEVHITERLMQIRIEGANEHNLKDVNVEIGDGLTVVTGVSGRGRRPWSSIRCTTRRAGAPRGGFLPLGERLTPADVRAVTGVGPAVAVGQNLLNRNPGSTLATASGLHPSCACSTPLRRAHLCGVQNACLGQHRGRDPRTAGRTIGCRPAHDRGAPPETGAGQPPDTSWQCLARPSERTLSGWMAQPWPTG